MLSNQQKHYSASLKDCKEPHNLARIPMLGKKEKKGKKLPEQSQSQVGHTSQRNLDLGENLLAEQLAKEP